MKPIVTMRHALEDPDLFGAVLPGEILGVVARVAHWRHGRAANR